MTVLISDKNIYNAEAQVLGVMVAFYFSTSYVFSEKIFNERAYDFFKAGAEEIVSVLKV